MKKSFTMIELIFVIIIIGVLSYTIIPYFKISKIEIAKNSFINNFELYKNIAYNINNYKIKPNDTNITSIQEVKYWFKKRVSGDCIY